MEGTGGKGGSLSCYKEIREYYEDSEIKGKGKVSRGFVMEGGSGKGESLRCYKEGRGCCGERGREGKGRRYIKTGKGGKECLGLHYGREGGKETYYYGRGCQGKVKDEDG